MSKAKKEIIQAAAIKLLSNIVESMPNANYKFIMGSATALVAANASKYLDSMLTPLMDQDGYIDTSSIKTILDGGFNASGGKVSIDLFPANGGLLSLFVKPLTLTIPKEDIDALIDEIEENSVKEVQLASSTMPKQA